MKHIIKEILPQVLVNLLRGKPIKWHGPYSHWAEAKIKSSGYDSDSIINNIVKSLQASQCRPDIIERDGELVKSSEISWQLLSFILYIAATKNQEIAIVDFGGGLGSTYFQFKKYLKVIKRLKWNIIEQENFVDAGKQSFQNDDLKFYNSFKDFSNNNDKPDLVIFSSVIQYLEDPYSTLLETIKLGPKFLLFDRTTLYQGDSCIMLQENNFTSPKTSYPCWIINKDEIISYLKPHYRLVTEFNSYLKNDFVVKGIKTSNYGFLFERK